MSPISKNELLRLQKKYGNDVEVGKKLGVTRQRIYHIRTKYGIPSTRADHSKRDDKLFAMREKGATFQVLSDKFGIARSNAYYIWRKHQEREEKAGGKASGVRARASAEKKILKTPIKHARKFEA
jgi:hypothetical protein